MRRPQRHDVEHAQAGIERNEHRRDDREIFGDVVGDREGGERTAGHQQLLAEADDLDQLGRIAVEVDHVARLARRLRAGVHRHADIGLRQRGRIVGAVAAHRDQLARLLFAADQRELVLGRRLREEIVDPCLGRDRRGGQRIVAGDHHRADAHDAQRAEAFADARLHHVLEEDGPQKARPVSGVPRHRQRRAAGTGDGVGDAAQLGRRGGFAEAGIGAQDRIDRAFLHQSVADADARDAGLRGEGDDLRVRRQRIGGAAAFARQHDDRAALGRFVRKAGEQRGLRHLRLAGAAHRAEFARLAVADGDRAGLVEQQHVDIARRLDRAARFGEHVEADQPVHAGDTDRRQQGCDRRRDERDEQGREDRDRDRSAGVRCEAGDGGDRDQEDDGQADEQDGERDLVRCLLPLRPLDQRDHPVEEALPRIDRHAHPDAVGDDARTRGHRRPVAARLADHRRAFAGDRGFVDRGDAGDHLAVGRDQVARLDQHDVADRQAAAGDQFPAVGNTGQQLGAQFRLGIAQARGLRLAAPFRQRLGEGAEQDGQPQPDDELELEAQRQAIRPNAEQHGEQQCDAGGDEHHRIADQLRGRELLEGVPDRGNDQVGGEQRFGGRACHQWRFLRTRCRGSWRDDPRWDRARGSAGR